MFPPHRGAGSRRRGGLERIRSRGRPVATLTMCGYTVGFVALFARCGGAKGGGGGVQADSIGLQGARSRAGP